MICEHCAEGANVKAELTDFLKHYTGRMGRAITNKVNGYRRRINAAHGRCPGGTWCDCQHLSTPHYRKPPGAAVALVSAR